MNHELNITSIEQSVSSLWGDVNVAVTAKPLEDNSHAVLPEEAAFLSMASPKRRMAFSTGRVCARSAMVKLGYPETGLPVAEDRSPVWPAGLCGSISHGGDCVLAVLAETSSIKSLGIDIEVADRLKKKLWRNVCVPEEIEFLNAHNQDINLATLIFSAKEAFYKCQHVLTKEWIGLLDACVTIDIPNNAWSITLLKDIAVGFQKGDTFHGKYVFVGGYVIAGMVM